MVADGQRLVERLLNLVCRVEVVFAGEYDERHVRLRRADLDRRHLEGGGVAHDVTCLRSRAYSDTTHYVRKKIYATEVVCQALKATPGLGGSSPTTPKSFSAYAATRTRDSVISPRASESLSEPPSASLPTSSNPATSRANGTAVETTTPSTPTSPCATPPNAATSSANS